MDDSDAEPGRPPEGSSMGTLSPVDEDDGGFSSRALGFRSAVTTNTNVSQLRSPIMKGREKNWWAVGQFD